MDISLALFSVFRFLGNWPSTLPLNHFSAPKSHVSDKHGSGVG